MDYNKISQTARAAGAALNELLDDGVLDPDDFYDWSREWDVLNTYAESDYRNHLIRARAYADSLVDIFGVHYN